MPRYSHSPDMAYLDKRCFPDMSRHCSSDSHNRHLHTGLGQSCCLDSAHLYNLLVHSHSLYIVPCRIAFVHTDCLCMHTALCHIRFVRNHLGLYTALCCMQFDHTLDCLYTVLHCMHSGHSCYRLHTGNWHIRLVHKHFLYKSLRRTRFVHNHYWDTAQSCQSRHMQFGHSCYCLHTVPHGTLLGHNYYHGIRLVRSRLEHMPFDHTRLGHMGFDYMQFDHTRFLCMLPAHTQHFHNRFPQNPAQKNFHHIRLCRNPVQYSCLVYRFLCNFPYRFLHCYFSG